MAAICETSAAPTEAVPAATGCTPAFSIAARISATATPAPDPPRAMPFSRTARAAPHDRGRQRRPDPAAVRHDEEALLTRISSSVSLVFLAWPTWVVRP